MPETPSILIVDDGELDRVERLLVKAGLDPVRMRASRLRESIEKPRDLLLMSWNPIRGLPALHDNPEGIEPVRVCVHSQDFLPLRERLRSLGVDYLVQSALDDDSLRLFLSSQLYRGPERRRELRLPLGGQVKLQAAGHEERVKLAELSRTTCRVICAGEFPVDTPLAVVLPKGLGGNDELALPGRVVRSFPAEARGARTLHSCVVAFVALPDAVRKQLDRIADGEQIGTRATPLRPAPAPDTATPALHEGAPDTADDERRAAARAPYERRIVLLSVDGVSKSALLIGRDLSTSGVAVAGASDLVEGAVATLALGGAARTEPVVVDATVVRAGEDDVGLRLAPLRDDQRAAIEKLMRGPAMVECLRDDPENGRRIVARLVSGGR
jgi:hypothetical protein